MPNQDNPYYGYLSRLALGFADLRLNLNRFMLAAPISLVMIHRSREARADAVVHVPRRTGPGEELASRARWLFHWFSVSSIGAPRRAQAGGGSLCKYGAPSVSADRHALRPRLPIDDFFLVDEKLRHRPYESIHPVWTLLA